MPSKQQIMPVSLMVACETYNCHKKTTWAIGREDGPRELWNYYCDQCMRDVVTNIPAGLLPPAPKINLDDAMEAIKQELTTGTDGCVPMVEELMDLLTEKGFLDAVEEDESSLTCEHCGKECKSLAGLQSHQRSCKAKGGKLDE